MSRIETLDSNCRKTQPRDWFWLMLWSVGAAAATVAWQRRAILYDNFGSYIEDELLGIGITYFTVAVVVWMASYFLVYSWLNRPSSGRARLWLGCLVVAFGFLTSWWLIWSDEPVGHIWTETQAVALVLVWPAIFFSGWGVLHLCWHFIVWLHSPKTHVSRAVIPSSNSPGLLWNSLVLWSILLAATIVIWRADDVLKYIPGASNRVLMMRLGTVFLIVALWIYIASVQALRIWRNKAASRMTCFWLVLAAVAMGTISGSLLVGGRSGSYWEAYSSGRTWYLPGVYSLFFLALLMWLRLLWKFFCWFFAWRILKRFLLGLAALVALAVMFRAEEDWRGKRAWDNYRREWEAKGERFDFASYIPSPVPDEQNFALTPIVATCYEWKFDKQGHELKPPRTNVVQRLMMNVNHYPPGDTVSQVQPTNGNWRIGKTCDLQSWQRYYRTPFTNMFLFVKDTPDEKSSYWKAVTNSGAILTNDFSFPLKPGAPAADVLLALSKYDADIEELRAASRLTNSRFPLNYDAKFPYEVYLTHLGPLKNCSAVLQLRAIAELEHGESPEALDDVMLMSHLIDSIRTEPFSISQIIRSEMAQSVVQVVWEGLARHQWSDAQLSAIERELGRLDFLADYQLCQRSERSGALAFVDSWIDQHSYSGIRKLTHDISQPVWFMSPTPEQAEEYKIKLARKVTALAWFYYLMPKGWYYQNELIIAKNYQEQFLQVVDPVKHLVSMQKYGAANAFIESLPNHNWNFLARRFAGAGFGSMMIKCVYAQASVDLARVACALECYRLTNGNYPESLDTLSPQFISQVPHDIIGGQPLHYRKISDGKFVLYSVGWNETDDGGTVVFRQNSTRIDDFKGDWVWKN